MSYLMRKFLTAYIEWVDAGAPEGKPFCRGYGLCPNKYRLPDTAWADARELAQELAGMFVQGGLEMPYPFGQDAYDRDSYHDLHHLHQPRIDWVRKQLAA